MPGMNPDSISELFGRIEQLNAIGISLSAEKDTNRLLEKILSGAMEITRADGGTVYLMDGNGRLCFEIVRNTSLGIHWGGSSNQEGIFQPIDLYDADGKPCSKTIAAHCALTGETVNIVDAYDAVGFDFSGTRKYDQETGYRSRSFLTIPLRDHQAEIIGVLQLINARDAATGETVSFGSADQRLAESLASQAAVALTNNRLILELRNLLETFIEVLASTIDEKSPYTGGHCRRVPEIAMRVADAVNRTATGPFAGHRFTDAEMYELRIAALLHDCGKISTPVHVVDKATKLESIFDRMHLVDARLEILRQNARINLLQEQLAHARGASDADLERLENQQQELFATLDEYQSFLHLCNKGSEFMKPEDQEKVRDISQLSIHFSKGGAHPLLTENEVYNLNISKGTLTQEERTIINNHIVTTLRMLQALPFPKPLRNVPDIAGSHHERMDGKGYPRGLKGEDMSVQARLMCIADIFEALTAADRPYKKAMPISQALRILDKMSTEGHVDPDLFDVFVHEKVYLDYGREFLSADQLDEVDESSLSGYSKRRGLITAK